MCIKLALHSSNLKLQTWRRSASEAVPQ